MTSPWRQALLVWAMVITGSLSLGASTAAWADATLGSGLKPDVRILIDISGSMKQSDPENLRAPALDLIVRLLPEGAKAGVWIFGQDVTPLVEHRVIDDRWRQQAQEAVAAIHNSGLRTNIPAALAAATYDLERMDPAYRSSIILLTDGKVDVSASPMTNASAAHLLLNDTAPGLGSIGIPIHTVVLSDEADWEFLRAMAQQSGGLAEKAESAGELTEIFLQSLEMVAPTARVPVTASRFQIDPSVKEYTALIFLQVADAALNLISPSGQVYPRNGSDEGVDWFENREFVLVTVDSPEPGQWQLDIPGDARARVTVISDLQLEVDPLPTSVRVGQQTELGLRLREKGRVLLDPEVLALFAITVELIGPQGERRTIDVSSSYEVPADGEFRVTVSGFEHPGRYEILAKVEGETLQRELPMYVDVTAVADTEVINTRGELLPEEDFKGSAIKLAGVLSLALILILWVVRRRRNKRLQLWRQRALEKADGAAAASLSGSFHAEKRG